jgi:branched-chain amino acid transport system ATP-binding protein
MSSVSGPVLAAYGLTKRFGGLTAVDKFEVELQPGEIVGVIGPNGAGKTTVFNLLTGVYKPTEGNISVCGTRTAKLTPDRVTALGIGRTFQNIRLFKDLTVLDNVKVGFQSRRKQSVLGAIFRSGTFRQEEASIEGQALELLDLMGLSALREARAGGLAYGQQRRLEIARALAARPKVLLLDEPAAGTNDTESDSLQRLIREIRQRFDLAILLIEHDMPFVMGLVSRLIVLDHGQTIARGTPEEIRVNPHVIDAYLGQESEA